ncbi:ribonuclease T2 family protein [Falsihalocynthiibacter arcticus]|uniref:Ribonuclease T n=1 Tax=Falsihalocynthiibacter arcticus TaxID=1579316 RepID=A0A126UZ32_9RHOB|nr:ribonuclease T2 [Falsihalocynthiibacter arcticus]AML51300.1 ribonuclease T [Falsihalocynthiibacter arcticus]
MRLGFIGLLFAPFFAATAWADGERAGNFDYYVLALSWSPNWCALEGDRKNSEQCDADQDFGWVLHGLWPQNERGWPSNCTTSERNPSRSLTSNMVDIMGTTGVAWYQWKKHGKCAGLSGTDYFAAARRAFESVTKPPVLRKITDTLVVPPKVIEEAFLQSNPQLSHDQITITCKSNYIQEARICLTKSLEPRRCGPDVIRDCNAAKPLFAPIN